MQKKKLRKPKPKRWLCQFREVGKSHFTTDCGFDRKQQAKQYVYTIVRKLSNVAAGQVFDNTKKIVVHIVQEEN